MRFQSVNIDQNKGKLSEALAGGDLRSIGKAFLDQIRDLVVDKTKAGLSFIGDKLAVGVGYAVSRSVNRSLVREDLKAVRDSISKGNEAAKAACRKAINSVVGYTKESFSNLRARNIDKVQDKHLAKLMTSLETITDPKIKEYLSEQIQHFKVDVHSFIKSNLEEYKNRPIDKKGESPVSELKSIEASFNKGLTRFIEAASAISEKVSDETVRSQLFDQFKKTFEAGSNKLMVSYNAIENPSIKDSADLCNSAYQGMKFLSKAIKNATGVYQAATAKGLDVSKAGEYAIDFVQKYSASLLDKITDGKFTSAEIVSLTKEAKSKVEHDVKSNKAVNGAVSALQKALDKLSPEERAAALAALTNGQTASA
jgi:hypothetical protein